MGEIGKITENIIKAIEKKAKESERKRAVFCFHKDTETLQRMVNVCLKETYVRPHKHENPDKLEIVILLKGNVAVFIFNDIGKILETVTLSKNGPNYGVEIPPNTWHSFVVLSKDAALFEIIEGRYDKQSHKVIAPWAPEEGTKDAANYVKYLKKQVNKA